MDITVIERTMSMNRKVKGSTLDPHLKSLMLLWRKLLQELGSWCHISTQDTERDFLSLRRRVEREGLSFLTITLPALSRDLERSLEVCHVDSSVQFLAFRKDGELPRFLGGFLSRIFDKRSGELLAEPDENSILAVRQLSLLFSKIELDCSEERTARTLVAYGETDREVGIQNRDFSALVTPDGRETLESRYRRYSGMLFADVFTKLDEDVYRHNLIPRHGPGATQDRLRGNAKFNQKEWTERLERILPYGEYAIPSWRYYYRLDDVDFRSPGTERPVRVTTVPKTQKAPRIIAIEPVCMQYMQQALMHRFVELLEGDDFVAPGVIGFTDQVPNQELAREGSRDGTLATLDLSEASDRVAYVHVMSMLHRFPHLREAVDACRSLRAHVPAHFGRDEFTIELNKFASMGSALTFPFEAMVFTTVIAMAIAEDLGYEQNVSGLPRNHRLNTKPGNRSWIGELLRGVRVYGDDLIIPSAHVASVVRYLELFGFKVNGAKSFWTGKFRESCGKEYFDGTDVSVTKCRRFLPSQRADVAEIVSAVSMRNLFFLQGLYGTAEYLDDIIGRVLPYYPEVGLNSPILGRLGYGGHLSWDRLNPETQSPEVKGYRVKATLPVNTLEEERVLMKWFLKQGSLPLSEDHMLRSGRPQAVNLKLGYGYVGSHTGLPWWSDVNRPEKLFR